MPPHRLTDVVRRAAGVVGHYSAAPDRDLLRRFVADRDADAFAELVRRHGAMVRGVCRRALGDTADADDACQAAFLVLARKAGSVRRADAVGSWLYGVARRVALRVRATTVRRREAPLVETAGPDTTADVTWRDGLRVLDEELARLPDVYRAPLVLCYLEGRTQDEAARQLGWSLGAFRGRLERGRARLRGRLDRRGVGLAVLAAVAAADTAAGAVPVGVVGTIVTTATAVAAGEAVAVPAEVAALADEVVRAMTMTKLQWAVGVVAVCGMLTAGGVWATGQGPGSGAGEPPAAGAGAKREPAAERTADVRQRQKSLNNLRQIMLTIISYQAAYDHLPSDIRDKNGKPLLSWRVAILPWMGEDKVYREFRTNEPWDSEHNRKLLSLMPDVYRVGFEPKDSTDTYYQVFSGPGAPLNPGDGSQVNLGRLRGGASNTLGVLEAGPPVPWTKPADLPFDLAKPLPKLAGPFGNVLHLGAMDGSCLAVRRDIPEDVFRRMISKDNREETPPLRQFEAVLTPAEIAAEAERVRRRIGENQQFIDRIPELMREHAKLLAGPESKLDGLGTAERLAEHLKQVAEQLTERNKKLRAERPKP